MKRRFQNEGFNQSRNLGAVDERKRPTTRVTKIAMAALSAAFTMILARPSLAAVVTNMTAPVALTFINPCNGDAMASTGTVHLLASTTIDSAGVQTDFHFNEQEFKDVDLITGAVCADTTQENERALNFDFSSDTVIGLPVTVSSVFNATARCGAAGGFTFRILAHATVNPDGTVTVFFNNYPPGTLKCVKSGG